MMWKVTVSKTLWLCWLFWMTCSQHQRGNRHFVAETTEWEVVIWPCSVESFNMKKGCIGHFKLCSCSGVPASLEQWITMRQSRQRVSFLFKSRDVSYMTPPVFHFQYTIKLHPLSKNTTVFVFTSFFFHCDANEEVCGASLTQQNKRFFYTPLSQFPVFNGTPLLDDLL